MLDALNTTREGPGMGQGLVGLPVSAPGIKAEPVELKPRARQRSPHTAGGLQPVPTLVKEEWGQVRAPRSCAAGVPEPPPQA